MHTSTMNGSIMPAKSTRYWRSGRSAPTRQTHINSPARHSSIKTLRNAASRPRALASKRRASGRPDFSKVSVKTGMNAADSTPSPKSRRNRLGRKKAIWKASVSQVAPNQVMDMSRTMPKTRDSSVRPATTLAARKKLSRSRWPRSSIAAARGSGGIARLALPGLALEAV